MIYYCADPRYGLFEITEDLGEQNNLADREPETCNRLATQLGHHLDRVHAQMPSIKATGDPVPYPGPR